MYNDKLAEKTIIKKIWTNLFLGCVVYILIGCSSSNKEAGDSFIDHRDGHVYKTIKIGKQTWMAENLAYLPSVSPSSYGSATIPYYYIYDYEGTDIKEAKALFNFKTYGVLYNWSSAVTASPDGWQLPSEDQWKILENYLKENGFGYKLSGIYQYETLTGKSLASTWGWDSGWDSTKVPKQVGNDLTRNNRSGFNALPGGIREESFFESIKSHAYFWSSSDISFLNELMQKELLKNFKDDSLAICRELASYGFELDYSVNPKRFGLSVRCVKKN